MSKNNIKNILIVGDWLIDEHWVTGIHRSPTSSRTGQTHYRVLQLPNISTILSLCGAGQTASILQQTKCGGKDFCKIIGLGIWHKADTKTLASMLDPKTVIGYTHHRFTHSKIDTNNNAAILINLGDLVEKTPPVNYGTTRIIRIYQHTGAKINLIQRIDWEIKIPYEKDRWITTDDKLNNEKLKAVLKEESVRNIDAIVIKDMCKGVVSSALIKWLAEKKTFKNVPWFISTKEFFLSTQRWIPGWLEELKEKNIDIRLLIIPQESTKLAVRNGVLKDCWITSSGHASKEAIEKIDELYNKFNSKPTIVALSGGSSVIARDKENGFLQIKPCPSEIETPIASVFFAALIANILNTDQSNTKVEILKMSLAFTQDWEKSEVERVKYYGTWQPGKEILTVSDKDKNKDVREIKWESFDWDLKKKEWAESFSERGIIANKGKKQLQLWRAMTDVNEYVCCVNSKRDVVQKLVREIGSFDTKEKRHHKSFMLVASPGSGKTFLVSRLAKSLGMRDLKFNITQMLSKSDILDCFDTIVTTQAQDRGEKIIVFFDEINAQLGRQYVYDTFLAPIEEGVYVRAGKTFPIDPCVWIFAGTEKPTGDPERTKSTKASDFEARLTIEVQNLKIDEKEEASARTEKVYLGASLLRAVFPDVSKISEKVLRAFQELDFLLEVREVEHFVKSFVNIQYGEVLWKNVPFEWLKNHFEKIGRGIEYKGLESREEGEMVEIVS